MRWFKHMSNARRSKKMMLVVPKGRHDIYGFWWTLLEVIANQMEKGSPRCSLTLNLKDWADETKCTSARQFEKLLSELTQKDLFAASLRPLISLTYGGEKEGGNDRLLTVECPNLLKYRDEYSKKSGHSPDKLPTESGETSGKIRSNSLPETEAETEGDIEAEGEGEESGHLSGQTEQSRRRKPTPSSGVSKMGAAGAAKETKNQTLDHLVKVYEFCESPGAHSKRASLSDLMRQGVPVSVLESYARNPKYRTHDFYDLMRHIRNNVLTKQGDDDSGWVDDRNEILRRARERFPNANQEGSGE